MTIQIACLLIGAILPYIWAGLANFYRNKQFGSIDNNTPRVQGRQLEGAGARVWGAQENAWEALIVFTAANSAALAAGVEPTGQWAVAAPLWVVARVLHGIFYTRDLSSLRGLAFVVGLAVSLWIFALALIAA